jgi:hypothetical protein
MRNEKDNIEKTAGMKNSMPLEEICEGAPVEFTNFLSHTRSLAFDEEPPYSEYREWFRELFVIEGFVYDGVYDWTRSETQGDIRKQGSFCCGQRVVPLATTGNMASPDAQGGAARVAPWLRGAGAGRPALPPRRCVFGNARPVAAVASIGRVSQIAHQWSSLPPLVPG